MLDFTRAKFIKSAAGADGFIRDGLPQIAFTGRSNVGKSSVINTLVRRKNFARVGSTPGKTAHVNYFRIGPAYITDLPGYGFAQVTRSERERWAKLMEAYFSSGCVTCGVLIVDARHKPTGDDVTMMEWYRDSGCPVIIVANKLDKLKKSEIEASMTLIRQTLSLDEGTELIPFSAEKGDGRERLLGWLLRLL
jgi:GTP-binding protein